MSALFFDIDGTILSEITHEIPESALVALRKAQENGHKTFINTGRTICSVPPMIKRIPFDGFYVDVEHIWYMRNGSYFIILSHMKEDAGL